MRNSYHGRSFGVMAITGNRGWRASSLAPFNVSWVEGGYPYRSPYGDLSPADYSAACASDLDNLITTTTSGDIACLIAEPIQGVGGFACPPDGFYGSLKSRLDEEDILFISDEVQTGWGRTGEHMWGWQAHGITPDIVTFAKGIGNGLTIGGVIARAELMDCVSAGSISTFGGNPLSTAGSLANLRYILANDLLANSASSGGAIFERLRGAQSELPMVGDIRGKGLMLAIELIQPGTQVDGRAGTPDPAAATAVLESCRERGLLVGKGGLHGNVIRMAPPMTLTAAEAEEGSGILVDALSSVQASLHGGALAGARV
jgi:4-aminobutyrate aminotransferase